jgi:hypothetical protein
MIQNTEDFVGIHVNGYKGGHISRSEQIQELKQLVEYHNLAPLAIEILELCLKRSSDGNFLYGSTEDNAEPQITLPSKEILDLVNGAQAHEFSAFPKNDRSGASMEPESAVQSH